MPYQRRSTSSNTVVFVFVAGAFLLAGAGAAIYFATTGGGKPKEAAATVQAPKDTDKKQSPAANTSPPKVSPPKVAPPEEKNADWERKSRAKKEEGLTLLKQGKRGEAKIALAYPFADLPRELTTSQQELMLETCDRLMIIAVVEKDEVMSKKYGTLSEFRRRELGWNVEKYNEWREPILVDTCARMGITK